LGRKAPDSGNSLTAWFDAVFEHLDAPAARRLPPARRESGRVGGLLTVETIVGALLAPLRRQHGGSNVSIADWLPYVGR